jgi:hypothetical protein
MINQNLRFYRDQSLRSCHERDKSMQSLSVYHIAEFQFRTFEAKICCNLTWPGRSWKKRLSMHLMSGYEECLKCINLDRLPDSIVWQMDNNSADR